MTLPIPPMCISCTRLDTKSVQKWPDLTCTAYPGGIPKPIVQREFDHRKPFAGDRGLQFEQDPNRPPPIPFD